MAERIDPKQFGMGGKTIIERSGPSNFFLIVDRKSRIIMADGQKILEKVEKIRGKVPVAKVCLKTSAPICSKTRKFLADHQVEISEI